MSNTQHYNLLKYLCGILFAAFSLSISAQEVIDTAQYRAVYEFLYKTKPDQTEYAKTDLMYLDIGPGSTHIKLKNILVVNNLPLFLLITYFAQGF